MSSAILKKRSLRDSNFFEKYSIKESSFKKRRIVRNDHLEIAKTSNLEKFNQMFQSIDYNTIKHTYFMNNEDIITTFEKLKEINSKAKKSSFEESTFTLQEESEKELFFPQKSKNYYDLQSYLNEDSYRSNPFQTRKNKEIYFKNMNEKTLAENPFKRNRMQMSDKNFETKKLKIEQFLADDLKSKKNFDELQKESKKISQDALKDVISCTNKSQVERVIKKLVRKVSDKVFDYQKEKIHRLKCSNTLLREVYLVQKNKCEDREKKNQELSEKYSKLQEEYGKVREMLTFLMQKNEVKNKDTMMCDERSFGGGFGHHGGPGIF